MTIACVTQSVTVTGIVLVGGSCFSDNMNVSDCIIPNPGPRGVGLGTIKSLKMAVNYTS